MNSVTLDVVQPFDWASFSCACFLFLQG